MPDHRPCGFCGGPLNPDEPGYMLVDDPARTHLRGLEKFHLIPWCDDCFTLWGRHVAPPLKPRDPHTRNRVAMHLPPEAH
jgi:hypothetical protein